MRLFYYKITLFITMLCVFAFSAKSQNYPVQLTTQLIPPYSGYLLDYADPSSEKLKIILQFNDFTVPQYSLRLKLEIKGNGFSMITKQLFNPAPIVVQPGIPFLLTGNDLAPYLNSNNLDFVGINQSQYEQSKTLPEGYYSICVTAYDYYQAGNTQVSREACAQAWFTLSDPPFLNLPQCNTTLTPQTPQNILFQWTPMNLGSPNSALNTEYEFSLWEMRPDSTVNPNQIVNNTLPIYTTTTQQTFINYGLTEPPLNLYTKYVWRVRAKDISGRDLFKNQGYSAICTFTYGSTKGVLGGALKLVLDAQPLSYFSGQCMWNAQSIYTNYILQLRKEGTFEWTEYNLVENAKTITGLDPYTTYEAQVRGESSSIKGDWSNIASFTTIKLPKVLITAKAVSLNEGECSWNPDAVFQDYLLQVRKQGTRNWFDYPTNKTSQRVTGLEPNTVYEVRVRGEVNGFVADWSALASFTTTNIGSLNLEAKVINHRLATCTWNTPPEYINYLLQVRKAGTVEWFDYPGQKNSEKINDLEPNTTYEAQVRGEGNGYTSAFSSIVTFTTQKAPTYNCNDNTLPTNINTTQPLPVNKALPGIAIQSGAFEVIVSHITPQGTPGFYTGKGYALILNLLPLPVKFENIYIDENNVHQQGIIHAETKGITSWAHQWDVQEAEKTPEVINGNIDTIYVRDGKYCYTLQGNETEFCDSLPKQQNVTVVRDSTGNQYNITFIDGEYVISGPTSYVVFSSDTLSASPDVMAVFIQSDEQKYGFDKKEYPEHIPNYECIKLSDGSKYYVPYKSVGEGKTDVVFVDLTIPTFNPNLLSFKTQADKIIPHTLNDDPTKPCKLDVPADAGAVYAWYNKKRIGKLKVESIKAATRKVIIVPVKVGNITAEVDEASTIQTALNEIYKQVNTSWTVTKKNSFQYDNLGTEGLEAADATLLAKYSTQMRELRDAYKQANLTYEKDAYYIFVVPKFTDANLKGYMVRGRTLGFVSSSPSAKTIAHELAHGAFGLEHTFPNIKETTSNNLLDYADGTKLTQKQWNEITSSRFVFNWLDSEEDGSYSKYAHYGLTPSGNFLDDFYTSANVQISAGEITRYITKEHYWIASIKYKEKVYNWEAADKAYVNVTENTKDKITVRKSDKIPGDEVNIFKPVGDNCDYHYCVINWKQEDAQSGDIHLAIQQKLTPATSWLTNHLKEYGPSCLASFLDNIAKKNRDCSPTQVSEDYNLLVANINTTDASFLADIINSVCLSSLRKLTYAQKVRLFTFLALVDAGDDIKEKNEIALLRLMNALETNDYIKFYTLLEENTNRLLIRLIKGIDDGTFYYWNADNKTNFIGALCWMFQYVNRVDQLIQEGDPALLGRIVSLKPYKFKETTWENPETGNKRFNSSYNEIDGTITVFQQEGEIVSGLGGAATEGWKKIGDNFPPISPLSPIVIILNNNDLPLLKTALEEAATVGNNQYIVPAIFLKYRAEKLMDKDVEAGISITFDAVTIYASGGAALAKQLSWVRRIWAGAEVAAAFVDIGIQTDVIKVGDPLYNAVDVYNKAMLLIGIKNLASANNLKGVYNFAKNLPREAKDLLQLNKNIKVLLMASYTDWITAITDISDLSAAEKQLVREGKIAQVTSIASDKRKVLEEEYKVWKGLGVVEDVINNVKNAIGITTNVITKSRIPDEFMMALEAMGKTEDEILNYFTKYHNDNSFRFLNEVEDLVTQYPAVTRAEAYALWGYTTDNFYKQLNDWLRTGTNLSQVQNMKNILQSALAKIPKYNGTAYRAIKLDGQSLTDFLNKHNVGDVVTYDEFISCGSTETAAFFNKPDKNIQLIMEVSNAPIISDFADGIKFRNYNREELLLLSGRKFKILSKELDNGVYKISVIQQ